MKKIASLICVALFSLIQGCTVLGFAGDLALSAAIGDINEDKQINDPTYEDELYFTKIGLEQDIKIVSGLLNDVAKAKHAETVITEPETRLFPANYVNKELCKQTNSPVGECHDADYYQQFYIKDEAEQLVP